jgi:SAM-dependent methyltransferase
VNHTPFIKDLILAIEEEKKNDLKSAQYEPKQSKPFFIRPQAEPLNSQNGLKTIVRKNRYANYLSRWVSSILKLPKLRNQLFDRIDRLDIFTNNLENQLRANLSLGQLAISDLESKLERITDRLDSSSKGQRIRINDSMNLDEYYFHFENRFRGSREQIVKQLQIYLPKVLETNIDFSIHPIFDIGCGRGEWLQVLQSEGIRSTGLDINEKMVDVCLKEGLDAKLGDAVAFLSSLPASSLGGVTAFQVVEHLPFELLIELFKECKRVLIPEGFVIFETPNPENYRVGACDFYYDMTHINPIPPAALGFLLGNIGFVKMETIRTQPVEEHSGQLEAISNPALKHLTHQFYGPRNYAIFGTMKPDGVSSGGPIL